MGDGDIQVGSFPMNILDSNENSVASVASDGSITAPNVDNEAAENAANKSGANGKAQIQNACDDADPSNGGSGLVVVPPEGPDTYTPTNGSQISDCWLYDGDVRVPSGVTIILYGRGSVNHVLKDETNRPFYTNDDFTNGNSHITLLGVNRPILDGNGDNQTKAAQGEQWKSTGVHFFKTDELVIKGLKLIDTNHWAVQPEAGDYMRVEDIHLDQTGISTESRDGVHIIGPAASPVIRNIFGITGDDFVALEATDGASKAAHGSGGNIHDYRIEDIQGAAQGRSIVFFFYGDGQTIKNGVVDGVIDDVNAGSDSVIRIGGAGSSLLSSAPQIHDFQQANFKNIVATQGKVNNQIFELDGPGKWINISDVGCFKPGEFLRARYDWESIQISNFHVRKAQTGNIFHTDSGTTLDGLMIENARLHTGSTTSGAVFDLVGTVNDLQVDQVHVRQGYHVFDVTGSANGDVQNLIVESGSIGGSVYNNISSLNFGPNVPAIASGVIAMGTTTGVKTASEAAVTSQEGRQLEVELVGPATGTTPAEDYEWRPELPNTLWDNSAGAQDVTVRANQVTAPSATWDLEYEIYPGPA